ncbi:MAG: hypothetical protein HFF56_09245, partial [Lawsonibacter sp.]|nr:hypothetical protein [Lawsonibacter sp.]
QRLLDQAMQAAAQGLREEEEDFEEEPDLTDTAEFGPVLPPEQEEMDLPLDEEAYEEYDEEGEAPAGPPRGRQIDFGRLQFGQDYRIT